MLNLNYYHFLFGLCASFLLLSGCDSLSSKSIPEAPLDREMRKYENTGKLFGAESIVLGGPSKTHNNTVVGLKVNPELWRASLDTIHFMPLISSDANGGVLVTDWYADEKKSTERLKVMIEIKGSALKVRNLKVTVYKQFLKASQWINSAHDDRQTATELENMILNKARQIRIKNKNIT